MGLVENIGHYIVDSGGKRLRPVVVLLSALANGYSGKKHLSAAAIIEFIHTATLLHDDVVDAPPCAVVARQPTSSGAMRPVFWSVTSSIQGLSR